MPVSHLKGLIFGAWGSGSYLEPPLSGVLEFQQAVSALVTELRADLLPKAVDFAPHPNLLPLPLPDLFFPPKLRSLY